MDLANTATAVVIFTQHAVGKKKLEKSGPVARDSEVDPPAEKIWRLG
jgi:hypothetical protein